MYPSTFHSLGSLLANVVWFSPHHLARVCIFPALFRSSRRVPVLLLLSVALLFCKTLTLLSACFSFVSVSSCIPLSVYPSPAPSASPDIHREIFSHVGYRFMTPARSPWPLNLIPSTKPHCFFVCVRACLWCEIVRKYVCACLGECVHALQGGGG